MPNMKNARTRNEFKKAKLVTTITLLSKIWLFLVYFLCGAENVFLYIMANINNII